MLKKLIKYDFRALAKVLLPLLLGLIALSVIFSLIICLISWNRLADNSVDSINSVEVMLYIILVMSFSAASVAATIFIYSRFYKNLMTDEGYLSFTLPATVDQHIISKLTTAIVWSVFVLIALIIAALLFVEIMWAMSCIASGKAWTLLISQIDVILLILRDYITMPIAIEAFFFCFFSLTATTLKAYLAITIGSISAKKNKILLSIAMFLAVSAVFSIIESVVLAPIISVMLGFTQELTELTALNAFFIASIITQAVVSVLCYFLTRAMLNKKLNI